MSNQVSFKSWLELCTTRDDATKTQNGKPSDGDSGEVPLRLRNEARLHFQALSDGSARPASPSKESSVTEDISKVSSATPNGALALLVSTLGPAFSPSANTDAQVRALNCLMGAMEGCKNLTHGVRQAVGRFLVELCRPDSGEGASDDEEESGDNTMDLSMDYLDAGNLSSEQVTQQLEAMAQRKRSSVVRSSKGTSSLAHEDVRDAAMATLRALLSSRLDVFPTQQSKKSESPVAEAMGVVYQSMGLRVELAILGLRYRCQTGKSDTSNGDEGMWGSPGDGYETVDPASNIQDGLSQLPRLKRSICFNLLEGALYGLKEDSIKLTNLQSQLQSSTKRSNECTVPSSLLKSMSTFTSLASSCMHGETDPRCLLQLLLLLNKIQQTMLPLFALNTSSLSESENQMDIDKSEVVFPSIDIFDAVAPYYPVQFTPPKNDPHGITRDMLQGALMAILCEKGATYKSQITPQINAGEEEEKETMIMLAGRMFLERLEPPKSSEYDPPSSGSDSEVEDKLDAIRDLSSLLLPQHPSSKNGNDQVPGPQFSLNVTRATPAFLSELSSSMARVHEEAVSSDQASLASAIRKFSSSLAYSLAPAAANASNKSTGIDTAPLWEAYVADNLRHLAPSLGSAPQGMRGRASTALLASMAAEGGLITLNKVLDVCYPRFLGVLSSLDNNDRSKEAGSNTDETSTKSQANKQSTRDNEKLAAAMRGIAALVSSCRVALQKWQHDNPGVQLHPHPLSSYLSDTILIIASVLNGSDSGDETGPLSLAAAGALESVLTSADFNALEESDMVSLEKSFSFISRSVLGNKGTDCNDPTNPSEWKTACARVLGAVVSVGLSQTKGSANSTASNHESMTTLAHSLLPEVLASAKSPPQGGAKLQIIRYDWMVLAGACANGTFRVSEQIVSEILSSIIGALKTSGADPRAPAMALSYIVRHGGSNVGTAFHSLASPGPTPFDLIKELCEPLQQGTGESVISEDKAATKQLQVGMSALQLPVSRAKDKEIANAAMRRAYSILPFLIPVYECPSSTSSCSGIVQFVDQILPPLSEWDELELSVALPLLAAVLNSSSQVWRSIESDVKSTLRSMITYLAQLSINSDHDVNSRSAAASCLFSILLHDESDDNAHTIQKLLGEVVSPALTEGLARLKKDVGDAITPRASGSMADTSEESMHSTFSRVEDALSLLSLFGSVAACRGGPFSQTSDKIASFLIGLACTGAAQFPLSEETMQLVTPSVLEQKHPLLHASSHAYILPASAFGSMLSVNNGGPFWRQRLTHKTLPILLDALQTQAKSQNPPALGTLAVVCHMLCCLPTSILGKSNMKQILPTIIAGLVYFSKNLDVITRSEMISSKLTDLLSIILAALVKILVASPEDVTRFVGVIIPSLLLLCSPTEPSEACIPKQLLVFQCLETLVAHPQARNSILREKDQVVAVLSGAVDHPSAIVRNAVVQTRNVWYTLE